jgi:hypothetical protein
LLASSKPGEQSRIMFENHQEKSGVRFVLNNGTTDDKPIIDSTLGGVALLDYDNDGYLDIFFTNGASIPGLNKSDRTFSNRLYRNNHDGTFTDVTDQAGVAGEGYSMGAAAADYDNDGWTDLYVTGVNRNILYHNNHDGTFTDIGVTSGCAFSEDGQEQAGMGVGVADYDCDGWLDIFKTNFADDTVNLFHNNGDGTFSDVGFSSGLAVNTRYVGWGCGFLDYDNDGWPDLMQINGHVYPEIAGHDIGQSYKNPRLVYRNLGKGQFKDVSAQMGPGITEHFSSRGAAFGDYNNDGAVDVLILNMNDPPSLLRNDGGNAQNWIKLKLIGTKCNRTAIGARVRVVTGTHAQMDEVHSGGSVMSQSDLRLHFGLGKAQLIDLIEVKWPTTQEIEKFTQVKPNQILTIREGAGIVRGGSLPTIVVK